MHQPSTIPSPEYAQTESPIFQNRSLDFCNSFWGFGDAGVNVLFARMRGAAQTIVDLNTFWKERASIEEDYAKRLAKLAQMTLGRDETGDLRKSLNTMAAETGSQAKFHLGLSRQFRSGLEIPTTALHVRLLHHKTTHQAGIEKLFKTKQSWESYVIEVREKYKQAYARIDSLEAQASLVLGKDREKINVELERTQKTIEFHERELSNISMALKQTVIKWEQGWKSFCDSCQDLEEHRMNFIENKLVSYANALWEVYHMADDACYESMRVSFDRMAGEKDLATFVLESGSGNQIPDPFDFVNYSPGTIPSASARPTSRIAKFTRPTSRELPSIQNSTPKEGPAVSATNIGDGKEATNDPDVGGSVVGASSHPITVPRSIPYTNDIQLTASMTNQNGGPNPFTTTPSEQLQNTISTSQNVIRPLPIPPSVLVSMVPKSTHPAGVGVAQELADWQPAFEEHMSPSQRNRTTGRHALSMNQISTAGGDGGGARLLAETPQHHDPSHLVWRSPFKPLLQAVDDVLDSDEADESGSYYSAVDEPEIHMSVMLPRTSGQLNLFLKQHEHNSLNSNVNPINFVINKMMKARRIAYSTHSTSGSSMKVDTDSLISRFSESAENFSPVSLSTSLR